MLLPYHSVFSKSMFCCVSSIKFSVKSNNVSSPASFIFVLIKFCFVQVVAVFFANRQDFNLVQCKVFFYFVSMRLRSE